MAGGVRCGRRHRRFWFRGCRWAHFGARVTALDDVLDDLTFDKGKLLEVLGGSVRLGPGSTATLPDDADLVIATGWPASSPLLVQAAARGVAIWRRWSRPGGSA